MDPNQKKAVDGFVDSMLSGETAGAQTPAPAPKPVVKETKPAPTSTEILLQIMLQREERIAKEEAAKELAAQAKDRQRDKNAKFHADKDYARQARCKHLKGGKNRLASRKDPALYIHTYINSESVIRCFICGAKWKVNDTLEYLVRDGKKVKNHTKLGWYEAQQMLLESTNTPSSSEIPVRATPEAEYEEVEQ